MLYITTFLGVILPQHTHLDDVLPDPGPALGEIEDEYHHILLDQ